MFPVIILIHSAKSHKGFPAYNETFCIMRNVYSQNMFIKCIVPCWYWCVCSEQRCSAHYFNGFLKRKVFIVNKFAESLNTNKRGMTFIAVVQVGFIIQHIKKTYTSHA